MLIGTPQLVLGPGGLAVGEIEFFLGQTGNVKFRARIYGDPDQEIEGSVWPHGGTGPDYSLGTGSVQEARLTPAGVFTSGGWFPNGSWIS